MKAAIVNLIGSDKHQDWGVIINSVARHSDQVAFDFLSSALSVFSVHRHENVNASGDRLNILSQVQKVTYSQKVFIPVSTLSLVIHQTRHGEVSARIIEESVSDSVLEEIKHLSAVGLPKNQSMQSTQSLISEDDVAVTIHKARQLFRDYADHERGIEATKSPPGEIGISLNDILNSMLVVDALGLNSEAIEYIKNAMFTANDDCVHKLKESLFAFQKEDKFNFGVNFTDLPRFARQYIEETFEKQMAINRLKFILMISEGASQAQQEKALRCIFDLVTGSGTSFHQKILDKIDNGILPLTLISQRFNLPSLDITQLSRACHYFSLMAKPNEGKFRDAIALAYVPVDIIGKGTESFLLDAPINHRFAQNAIIDELIKTGYECIEGGRNSDKASVNAATKKWDWVVDAIDRMSLKNIAYESDFISTKHHYCKSMCHHLDVVNKYLRGYRQGLPVPSEFVNIKDYIESLDNPLIAIFNNEVEKIAIPAFAGFKDPFGHQFKEINPFQNLLRTGFPNVDFPPWFSGEYAMDGVKVSCVANNLEIVNSGIDITLLDDFYGNAGIVLIKMVCEETGNTIAVASLVIDEKAIIEDIENKISQLTDGMPEGGLSPSDMERLLFLESALVDDKNFYNHYLLSEGLRVENIGLVVDEVYCVDMQKYDTFYEQAEIFLEKMNVGLVSDVNLEIGRPIPHAREIECNISSYSSACETPFHGLAGIFSARYLSKCLPSNMSLIDLFERAPENCFDVTQKDHLLMKVDKLNSLPAFEDEWNVIARSAHENEVTLAHFSTKAYMETDASNQVIAPPKIK